MKAWIIQLWWEMDPAVTGSVVFFGDSEPEVMRLALTLYQKTHGINYIERAPWLDKPE